MTEHDNLPIMVFMDEKEIIEGMKPICLCKGVRKCVFLKHIRAGIKTVDGLRKATGAGCGSCGGKRCTSRIEELLHELTGTCKPGETKGGGS